MQAEKLFSTCSGVPQAVPVQATLLGATWGNQAPLQCCRCLQCNRGHCKARDRHLLPLISQVPLLILWPHIQLSIVLRNGVTALGCALQAVRRAARQLLPHHCISEARGQPGLSHPTCACQSQHRKAALREKQPSSSPFTFVTSSASDQIPSFALETFQNSPNLCKFSVCLFLSL